MIVPRHSAIKISICISMSDPTYGEDGLNEIERERVRETERERLGERQRERERERVRERKRERNKKRQTETDRDIERKDRKSVV